MPFPAFLPALLSALFLLLCAPPALAGGPFTAGWREPSLRSPHWPSWSHEHWVWENEGTEDSAYQLVDDYLQRGIPVSALIIDRPWDVAPSNFTPDPNRYPHLGALISKLHSRQVRVMLWAVSILNSQAPEFAEAKAKGYFLNGGRLVPWWGGKGGMLDYKNPEAVAWWHSRMNQVLDLGIDGWKLDGTDPFSIYASVNGPLSLAGSVALWKDYQKAYYTDFWSYSKDRTGKKFVITARPVDSFNIPYLPRTLDPFYSFAPYELSFAGWVGDQDGNWNGLRAAIANMKESAKRGFLSFGSDTSGFRNSGGLREPELFVRWTQLSAFNGVFENGGSGEHRPWLYGPQVEGLYRRFAKIHHALVPYLFSSAAWAFENHASLYRNLEHLGAGTPGKWDFLLGPNLAVAALDAPGGLRQVRLPEGEWLPFFHPEAPLPAARFASAPPLEEYPVFIRNGSLFPMKNFRELGAFSSPDAADTDDLNVLLFAKPGQDSFPVYLDEGEGGTLAYRMENERALTFQATNVARLRWLRVRAPSPNALRKIQVQGQSVPPAGIASSPGNAWWIPLSACRGSRQCEVRLEW